MIAKYDKICQNMTISQKGSLKKKKAPQACSPDAPGLGLPNIGQIWSDLSYILLLIINYRVGPQNPKNHLCHQIDFPASISRETGSKFIFRTFRV